MSILNKDNIVSMGRLAWNTIQRVPLNMDNRAYRCIFGIILFSFHIKNYSAILDLHFLLLPWMILIHLAYST